MTTEFDDSAHYGIFTTAAALNSSTGKMVRQSELVLAALRAQGVFDNMIDGTSAPATDKLWLDKNSDPAVLKEYDSVGSSWEPMTFDRLFGRAVVTALTNVGGTADAITVDKPTNFIANRLYSITPTANNTGAASIQVTGVGTYDVEYTDGSALDANELVSGESSLLLFTSGVFQVVIAKASGYAAQAAAEAAQDAAEDAQVAAESAAGANLANADSRAAAILTNIPASVNYIRTAGYASAGDGGGALYKSAASEPSHEGKFQSADGAWWELAETIVDAKMFGSDGAAVQSAIDFAPDGGSVEINDSYDIGSDGILIDARNDLTIRGAGTLRSTAKTAQTITGGSGTYAIKVIDSSRVSFLGLKLDGNSVDNAQVGFEDCADCAVDGCEAFNAAGGLQIRSKGSTRTKISNNIVRDGVGAATRGIYVGGTTADEIDTDALIYGNRVSDNTATGIVVTSVGGSVFGNRSENNGGSGIIFPGAGGVSAKRISCSGNVCSGNVQHGIQSDIIYTSDADLSDSISVNGNICFENNGSGIYAVNVQRWSITGNICFDNNVDASGTGAGIQVEERAYEVAVSGNNCFDTRSGASRTQTTGIWSRGQAQAPRNIAITGNVCRNNTSNGISASVSTGLTYEGLLISNNTCDANAVNGIFVSETDVGSLRRCIVSGNVCTNNGARDIRADIVDVALSKNRASVTLNVTTKAFTDADTTPSVRGRRDWAASNTGATSITTFDDADSGHEIEIYATNANTTLVHGASTIALKGATNAALPEGGFIVLKKVSSTLWVEVSRSF